jgi:hypothetical protein
MFQLVKLIDPPLPPGGRDLLHRIDLTGMKVGWRN